MGRIFSLHEYDLRPGAPPLDFERALREGAASGLLEIPGLAAAWFGRGVKGSRLGHHAALWIYPSRAAWEQIWGPAERPHEIRRLMQFTDPQYVFLTPDTAHINLGGVDMQIVLRTVS